MILDFRLTVVDWVTQVRARALNPCHAKDAKIEFAKAAEFGDLIFWNFRPLWNFVSWSLSGILDYYYKRDFRFFYFRL